MLEVFRRFGSVQYDPIDVAGRTHDLMLHARVADYDTAWTDELYERREIFEAYNKGLSFVIASEYPWFRGRARSTVPPVIDENPEAGERVLERIRADGPLSSLDFESERGSTTDWFGVPTNTVRALLEAYTATGVLGLARREGKRRYYDLLERLLPAKLLRQDVPLVEQMRHKLHSRFRVHGLLGVGGGGDIFGGIGPAKPDPRFPGHPGRTALREELIESGDIAPVQVEGVSGKRFVLREEVALLEAPPEPTASVALLPPFDPLVWDRETPRLAVRVRLRVGALPPAGQAAVGLVRATDPLRRPARRPHRAADRPRRRAGGGDRALVGGRLRAEARQRVR